jgi:hypothetical protein
MIITEFNQSTFPLEQMNSGRINAEELKAFTTAVVNDLEALAAILNNDISPILRTLPEATDVNPRVGNFDGTNIYLDSNASKDKDKGVFFDTISQRPMTIYEVLIFFLRIIADLNNGLKEGVTIGNIASPIVINAGSTYSVSWPYLDGLFDYQLQVLNNNMIYKAANITVGIDTVTKEIKITNNNNTNISIFGVIWHPVYTF